MSVRQAAHSYADMCRLAVTVQVKCYFSGNATYQDLVLVIDFPSGERS